MKSFSYLLVLIAGVFTGSGLHAQTVPACSATPALQELKARWDFVQGGEFKGALAFDPETPFVGSYSAKKFLAVFVAGTRRNWTPALPEKTAYCGRLTRFKWYDGLARTREQDWNLFLLAAGASADLFADMLKYSSRNAQVKCPRFKGEAMDRGKCDDNTGISKYATDPCLEGEVTPPVQFFNYEWFRRNRTGDSIWPGGVKGACSKNVDEDMCVYGPLVIERAHSSKMEIHPVEVAWWKEGDRDSWVFIHLQDDSSRFYKKDNFSPDPPNPPPARWAPWAGSPRHAILQVGFRVPSKGPGAAFSVLHLNSYEDGNGPPDDEFTWPGKTSPLVTIKYRKSPGNVEPGVAAACLDAATNDVIGFVEVRSVLNDTHATSSPPRQDYRAVRIQRIRDASEIVLLPDRPLGPTFFLALEDTRFERDQNRWEVRSNLVALRAPGADLPEEMFRFMMPKQVEALKEEGRFVLREGVNLSRPSQVTLPTMGDTAFLMKQRPPESIELPEIRLAVVATPLESRLAAGSPLPVEGDIATEARFESVDTVAESLFAVKVGEDVKIGETFGPGQDLNFMLAQTGKISELSREDLQPRVDVKNTRAYNCGRFTHPRAWNCDSPVPVEVRQAWPVPNSKEVYLQNIEVGKDHLLRFRVTFPSCEECWQSLYRVVVTVEVRDPATGEPFQIQQVVFSKALGNFSPSPERVEETLCKLASALDIPCERLGGDQPGRNDPLLPLRDARVRKARLLRSYVLRAVEDRYVDPEEIRRILAGAVELSEASVRKPA